MRTSKVGTVVLVVSNQGGNVQLVDTFSDDKEIGLIEDALQKGLQDPLGAVYEMRTKIAKEEEEFGDYVEELLCQPCVRPEIQEHGVQWLKSKMRIEQYHKCELEATQVIAGYAFKLFQEDRRRTDFFLAGPASKVRVKVIAISKQAALPQAA